MNPWRFKGKRIQTQTPDGESFSAYLFKYQVEIQMALHQPKVLIKAEQCNFFIDYLLQNDQIRDPDFIDSVFQIY